MTEPMVDEIVARWEQQPGAIINQHEIDRIIASWRERGEALDQSETAARKRVAGLSVCTPEWETACLIADEIAGIRRRASLAEKGST